MDIDWARTSGAISVSCGILSFVVCAPPLMLGSLAYGAWGIAISPSRGYTIVAALGVAIGLVRTGVMILYLTR